MLIPAIAHRHLSRQPGSGARRLLLFWGWLLLLYLGATPAVVPTLGTSSQMKYLKKHLLEGHKGVQLTPPTRGPCNCAGVQAKKCFGGANRFWLCFGQIHGGGVITPHLERLPITEHTRNTHPSPERAWERGIA